MGISIWQLIIILTIIVLLFGTTKLRNIGADLGNAVKGFKKAVDSDDEADSANINNPTEKVAAEQNQKTVTPKNTSKASTEE